MSLSLNINNFCEGAVPSILNKNYLDNTSFNVESTNSSIVPNKVQEGTSKFHQNAFLDANLNLNDNISFFNEDILSNLNFNNENNDKDPKVGTINVYNKCVFLLNKTNEENNTKKNNNDNNSQTSSRQINHDPHFPKTNIVENNVSNNHRDNYFHSANSTGSVSSNLKCIRRVRHKQSTKPKQQQQQHITEKQHKLFFCHNNDLIPILSPMIKSGVYRKLYGPGEKKIDVNLNLKNQKFTNVCVSTNDVCGKVITLEEFQKNYVEETDFDEIVSYSPPNCSVLPPVPSEKPSFNPTVTNNVESCVSTTTHSPDELNTFARNILNFQNGKLENFTINKEQNRISYKNSSNKKHFKYRLMFPEEFGDLRNPNGCTNNSLLPFNTRSIKDCPLPPFSQESNKTAPFSSPICPLKKTISRRGRPRKPSRNQTSSKGLPIQQEQNTSVVMVKTRYGRLSKLPSHIQEDFKVLNNNNEIFNEKISIAEMRDEIKDKDYKFFVTEKDEPKTLIQDCNPKVRRERNISSEYQCKVCNKIFFGKRIKQHYEAYPDHNITKTREIYQKFLTETTLYKFLVEKIKLSSCLASENRADIFLNEISDLVKQLQSRSSRLVQNTSGMHFVNSRISKVLGIPEGHYCINADEIDSPPDDPQSAVENENSNLIDVQSTGPPRLDYNLSMSLDDTIADAKLNMITSDDSLLRTVNDLMEEGIKNLTGGNHVMDNALHHHPHHHHHQTTTSSVMHYDHASDNAVEAVSIKETQPPELLDLSLDLFQFNSN